MSELLHQNKGEPTAGPDAMKSEHLAEGSGPIITCVGTKEQFGGEIADMVGLVEVGHDVDYSGDPEKLEGKGYKNAGRETYVISIIDEKPKFTENLCNCTGMVAVGKSIETGRDISFLTHQDPAQFLKAKKEQFVNDLKGKLNELKKKCVEGTVDVVLVGGNIDYDYDESIDFLNALVKETFGFSPVVAVGPKEWKGDDAYFDTSKRRLLVMRPSEPHLFNASFNAGKMEGLKEKWKKQKEEDGPGPLD
jgi:hypothetical protein